MSEVPTVTTVEKRIDSHAPDTVEEVTVEEIGEAREASTWDTGGNRGVLEYDPNNVDAPAPEDVAPSDTDPSWWSSAVAVVGDVANSLYGQKTADAVGEVLDYLGRSTEQVVYGDYTDEVTALGTGVQIVAGFFGVDIIADVRDLSANIINWEWSWSHAGITALNVVGLLPVIGVLKNADEVGTLVKNGMKQADNVADAAQAAKRADDFVKPKVAKQAADNLDDANRQLRALQDYCFAPETPVATPDGPRPIGEIRTGDVVLAFDHREGSWRERQVEKFHESIYEGPLLTITTDSGTVRCTIYHPFWVLSGRDLDERGTPRELADDEDQGLSLPGRWVNSHELRVGDVLIGQDGQQHFVRKIEQEFVSGFLVHNLTIDGDHTFAVGADAVLVHNTAGCPDLPNKNIKPLPTLDDTGRLHGVLPKPEDLRRYSRDELEVLRDQLRQSIPKRIEENSALGPKGNHGLRQRQEQDLIKAIDKILGDLGK